MVAYRWGKVCRDRGVEVGGGGLEQPGQGRTELLEKKLDVMKRKEWNASKHETFHLHFRTISSFIFCTIFLYSSFGRRK